VLHARQIPWVLQAPPSGNGMRRAVVPFSTSSENMKLSKTLFLLAVLFIVGITNVSANQHARCCERAPQFIDAAVRALDGANSIPLIMAAVVPATPAKAAAGTPATSAPPGAVPAAVSTPATAATIADDALVQNGVLDQVISRIGTWFDGLADQLSEAGSALAQLRSINDWWTRTFAAPDAEPAALRGFFIALSILAAAELVEALLYLLLRRLRRQVAGAVSKDDVDHDLSAPDYPAGAPQDGLPQELAMPLETGIHDALGQTGINAHAAARTANPQHFFARHHIMRNRGLLRRLPYAFADAVLNLVPLVGFVVVSSLLMSWRVPAIGTLHQVLLLIVNAYVWIRITMAAVRLMASPRGQRLRLLHMSDAVAAHLTAWARAIVITAAFGTAFADVLSAVGMGSGFRILVLKLVALAVHLMLIVVIVQTRIPVANTIRGQPASVGHLRPTIGRLRRIVADIWATIAVLFVFALWLVWAMGVNDGWQRLLHFFGVSAAVLVGMRLLSIVAQGMLDGFFVSGSIGDGVSLTAESQRYRRWLRAMLHGVVGIATALLMLGTWGLDPLSWFSAGTIGRRMASAVFTIWVAALLAVMAWEAIGFALRRRIARWTARGDVVRVSRLRTLTPMMRTLLLVVIGVIVVLTALNQLGVNTAPLLAGASIIGVALGFGSQKLVQDFITGLFLLMENAMQVGDWITVAGVSGSVEYLSIRTVRLRAGDGSLHVVPFSSVTTVNNTNRGLGNASVRVSVVATSDIPAVFDALRAIGDEMRKDATLGPLILADIEIWGVDQIDGNTVTISGQIRTLDRGRWPVQRAFNLQALERFRELGIVLANPQQSLLVEPMSRDVKTGSGVVESAVSPAATASPGSPASSGSSASDATAVSPASQLPRPPAVNAPPGSQVSPAGSASAPTSTGSGQVESHHRK
jgi:small-conductance mechanosensitive channel